MRSTDRTLYAAILAVADRTRPAFTSPALSLEPHLFDIGVIFECRR